MSVAQLVGKSANAPRLAPVWIFRNMRMVQALRQQLVVKPAIRVGHVTMGISRTMVNVNMIVQLYTSSHLQILRLIGVGWFVLTLEETGMTVVVGRPQNLMILTVLVGAIKAI